MSKHPVALIHCPTYDETTIQSAVQRGINLLGGAAQFARPGERILLKPNLLAPDAPAKAVTTHPAVLKAVARVFQEAGATVSYGDSPSMWRPYTVARAAGLADAADAVGVPLADFEHGETISFPGGRQNKRFTIARGALAADGIISLPKLKTHNLTRFTGAIKNQFGCVPGKLKSEFHLKLPEAGAFSRMLVDLNRYLQPRLYVMDGIVGMEGNGPRGGTPARLNVLIFATNPAALDAIVSRIVGVEPATVPPLKWAAEFGLGSYQEADIELRGDPLAGFLRPDFKVPRGDIGGALSSVASFPLVRHLTLSRPVINHDLCTRCGTCVRSCPITPKAVNFRAGDRNSPPVHYHDRCIRCYCCQENCPERAITVETPLLGRVMPKIYDLAIRVGEKWSFAKYK